MEQHEQLRKYNRWRRGDKRLKMPDPKELGKLIDGVAEDVCIYQPGPIEIDSLAQIVDALRT